MSPIRSKSRRDPYLDVYRIPNGRGYMHLYNTSSFLHNLMFQQLCSYPSRLNMFQPYYCKQERKLADGSSEISLQSFIETQDQYTHRSLMLDTTRNTSILILLVVRRNGERFLKMSHLYHAKVLQSNHVFIHNSNIPASLYHRSSRGVYAVNGTIVNK